MNTNNINKLDPGSEEIQQMVELVTEKIIDFMENLDEPVLFDIEKSKQQITAVRLAIDPPEVIVPPDESG